MIGETSDSSAGIETKVYSGDDDDGGDKEKSVSYSEAGMLSYLLPKPTQPGHPS